MSDEGIKDFLVAKRKAATRLGVSDRALLPSNVEIQKALVEHQRLFHAHEQPIHLRALREAALEAMRFFARFHPRLVGSVLNGTANPHSEVSLHLFADTPEEVVLFLMEHDIPFEATERRVRMAMAEWSYFPVYGFRAGDINMDLTVFPGRARRQPPLSPVDGKPMSRADMPAVKLLLRKE
jgi:hypothetical protein